MALRRFGRRMFEALGDSASEVVEEFLENSKYDFDVNINDFQVHWERKCLDWADENKIGGTMGDKMFEFLQSRDIDEYQDIVADFDYALNKALYNAPELEGVDWKASEVLGRSNTEDWIRILLGADFGY